MDLVCFSLFYHMLKLVKNAWFVLISYIVPESRW